MKHSNRNKYYMMCPLTYNPESIQSLADSMLLRLTGEEIADMCYQYMIERMTSDKAFFESLLNDKLQQPFYEEDYIS